MLSQSSKFLKNTALSSQLFAELLYEHEVYFLKAIKELKAKYPSTMYQCHSDQA